MKIAYPILLLFLLSCYFQPEKLFWIDKGTNDRNDFLNMVESANVPYIASDSLRVYLNWDEIKATRILESTITANDLIIPEPVRFKDYGEIYNSNKFKVHVLLQIENDTLGRNYSFFIRTYSNDWKIIDTYTLAVWNKSQNKFCFGSINEKLIIERECEGLEQLEIMKIDRDGRIVGAD